MENEIIKLASSQGIWTSLAVFLIFYILRIQEKRDLKQEEREKDYQHIINRLTEKFDLLEDIKTDIIEIKEKLSI